MPRLLLAGGLDHERAAFAAELADEWNSVPAEYEPFNDPMRVLVPEEVSHLAELATGDWVLHGNHFTEHQARAVSYASSVIIIGFHDSQIGGSKEYRAVLKSRNRVRDIAYAHHHPPEIMADMSDHNPQSTDVRAVNGLERMGAYLLRYKLHECRGHLVDLKAAHFAAHIIKDPFEGPF
jgi:hypothetical protein